MPELYAKPALGLIALVVAASPRVGSGGVTVALPPGWHAVTPIHSTSYPQPVTRLVVSSGPIGQRLTGTCHTQVADYTFPPTAVAIVVLEWTKPLAGIKIGIGPRRPRRFTAKNLPVVRPEIECFGGPGGSAQWSERGHTFGAYVLLGRKAPTVLAARARAVLDTLRVAPR
jgi:hypothetical protein